MPADKDCTRSIQELRRTHGPLSEADVRRLADADAHEADTPGSESPDALEPDLAHHPRPIVSEADDLFRRLGRLEQSVDQLKTDVRELLRANDHRDEVEAGDDF